MPAKFYKPVLSAIVAVLMVCIYFVQRDMVHDRDALGLTRYTELKGAPPMLALTTVALGGFRGLISNALWIRASDLQDNGKYFEMVQLADWITKLEPHFTQVWLVQAWNMAYNISVKFKDEKDRWRWVEQGIELLRDRGLYYNPHDVLMHRELAWFFQHKMGQNLDDAHGYYKRMWAREMTEVFGANRPNWPELLNPQTDEAKRRVALLKDKYKLDPVFMKQVDDTYGPLEWRLPETHAIYWACQGLEDAKYNERLIDPKDLLTLRRVIYQSMQTCFERGRLIANKADGYFEYGPNLDIIPNANKAYEKMMEEDPADAEHISIGHRNFLRNAVYFLYTYNHEADALNWFKYLIQKYPNKPLLDGVASSMPGTMSLDDYCMGRIQNEVNDPGHDKAEAIIEGMEARAYASLAEDDDDRYIGLDHLAQKLWLFYQTKITTSAATVTRVGLRPMREIKTLVLTRMIYEEMSPEFSALLRTRLGNLGIPVPPPPPKPEGTNAVENLPPTLSPANGTNSSSVTNVVAPETTVK